MPASGTPITRILVPIDFSDNAQSVISYVTSMAEQYSAKLELLYVVPTTVVPLEAFEITPDYTTLTTWARENLQGLAEREFPAHLQVNIHVREGEPFREIVEAAKEFGCDLIVMSTHGHTGLRHLVLGSTTERVVRTSPLPVLTLRVPEPG